MGIATPSDGRRHRRRTTGPSAYARARHRLGEQGPLFWITLTVLVVLPVGWVGARSVHTVWRLHQAEVELEQGLPDGLQRSEDERRRLRAMMAERGHTEREYAWRELFCTMQAEGTVWVADNHVQVCEVRSVDVYPAEPTARRWCEDSEVIPYRHRPDWLWDLDLHERHGVEVSTYDHDVSCQQLLGVEWFRDDEVESRLIDGEAPTGTGEWLVTVHSTPVSETSIGCHPLLPVLCAAPGRPRT